MTTPAPLFLTLGTTRVRVTKSPTIVGRHWTADIRLPLADVSRRHCELLWKNDQWTVRDLESLNGTSVNENQINKEIPLQEGDILRIGSFALHVAFAAEEEGE
ncbi:hypothetical protein COU77_03830 [Candidatus Peregrinibacteria bacterium CG10_big_fil_rev_8_21_14_0_10_49_16]|nr:MAG: hypothetical protein COW95_00780 [Candidatus Peregrinibacteria bacterium CG22_combo_CG10-13_8_21_14_all_49_11]PIR51782.1 MAG: hypothetical protein COU77_03830 [Candidatus Peregrinibacteria bacterium CG10_big_fil_rev_8_21_14_0_10_49_16]